MSVRGSEQLRQTDGDNIRRRRCKKEEEGLLLMKETIKEFTL